MSGLKVRYSIYFTSSLTGNTGIFEIRGRHKSLKYSFYVKVIINMLGNLKQNFQACPRQGEFLKIYIF